MFFYMGVDLRVRPSLGTGRAYYLSRIGEARYLATLIMWRSQVQILHSQFLVKTPHFQRWGVFIFELVRIPYKLNYQVWIGLVDRKRTRCPRRWYQREEQNVVLVSRSRSLPVF